MTTPPVACTLTPDQQCCHASELLPQLSRRAVTRDWTADGVRLTFAPTAENLDAIAQTVNRERECCALLEFRLDVPAAKGAFTLLVSGPEGTGAFLRGIGIEARAP